MNTQDELLRLQDQVAKLTLERNDWWRVADQLAADIDSILHWPEDLTSFTKFKELEKKYSNT